jgi:hypothetical protein
MRRVAVSRDLFHSYVFFVSVVMILLIVYYDFFLSIRFLFFTYDERLKVLV